MTVDELRELLDAAPGYLSIPGWSKFQHYSDRRPPWIKLHEGLLDDYEFESLTDATKAHVMLIWLIASKHGTSKPGDEPRIPNDAEWIGRRIGASEPVDLDAIIAAGFVVPCEQSASTPLADRVQRASTGRAVSRQRASDAKASEIVGASNPLASCEQVAAPETEAETEAEAERTARVATSVPDMTSVPTPSLAALTIDRRAVIAPWCEAVADAQGESWTTENVWAYLGRDVAGLVDAAPERWLTALTFMRQRRPQLLAKPMHQMVMAITWAARDAKGEAYAEKVRAKDKAQDQPSGPRWMHGGWPDGELHDEPYDPDKHGHMFGMEAP